MHIAVLAKWELSSYLQLLYEFLMFAKKAMSESNVFVNARQKLLWLLRSGCHLVKSFETWLTQPAQYPKSFQRIFIKSPWESTDVRLLNFSTLQIQLSKNVSTDIWKNTVFDSTFSGRTLLTFLRWVIYEGAVPILHPIGV